MGFSDNRYDSAGDEELVLRLRDGEREITEYLLDKYKNLVRGKAKSMYILGAEPDDLIQEGMIGLFKAIRDYDPGRDASFFTFADLCVSRQMYTAVTASSRKKHSPLNNYVSFIKDNPSEESDGNSLLNTLTADSGQGPEDLLIDKENVEDLLNWMEAELSGFEKEVMDLYLTGMDYATIAKVLGKTGKATDNALQRAKSKLKKYIETKNKK